MGFKRSLSCLNRTKSRAFFDILLETLVVLVLVTELSVQCVTRSFPSLREVRVDPNARGGFFKGLMLVWQGPEIWQTLFTSSAAIDHRVPTSVPIIGSMALLSATGALYATLAAFLYANRSWRPSVTDIPYWHTFVKHKRLNVVLWFVYLSQGIPIIVLIAYHCGLRPIFNYAPVDFVTTWLYLIAIPVPFFYFRNFGFSEECKSRFSQTGQTESHFSPTDLSPGENSVDNPTVEKNAKNHNGKCNGVFQICRTGAAVIGRVLCDIIIVFCYFLLLLCVYAAIPLIPTLIWAGLLRCSVAMFGNACIFTSCMILSCFLIIYSTGRMLGLWMAEINAAWILRKLMLSTADKAEIQKTDREIAVAVTALEKERNWYKELVGLLLDFMAVCLVCEVVKDVIESYTTQCRAGPPGMSAKISYWIPHDPAMRNVSSCFIQNYTLSSYELAAGEAGRAIVEVVGTVSSQAMYIVVFPFYVCTVCAFLSFLAKRCCGSGKKSVKFVIPGKIQCTAEIYRWEKMEVLMLWYFVKVIIPISALDFFLSERYFFPGIMMWLSCCTVTFGWKLIRMIFICANYLWQLRTQSREKRLGKCIGRLLIENATSGILEVQGLHCAPEEVDIEADDQSGPVNI